MNTHYYVTILAGGVGSRFWPLSKEERPKQFINLTGTGSTFLRQTYDRYTSLVPQENIFIITLDRYKSLVKESIPEIKDDNILLEPYGRNTAPSLAYAMYYLLRKDKDAVMVVSPADHLISNVEAFRRTISSALDYAAGNEALVTLGVVPDRADTNFGYIQVIGGKRAYLNSCPVKVKTFTEKPDAGLAEIFVQSGEFLWNSGIFVWRADVIRKEMEQFVPRVTRQFNGWEKEMGSPSQRAFIEKAYAEMEKIAIDYAVMEKTEIGWLFPADFEWADIGNWESLYGYLTHPDDHGNAVRAGKTALFNSNNNLIYTKDKKKLVTVNGLEGYVIIDTGDVLMICPRNDEKIKEITAGTTFDEFSQYR